MPHSIFKVRDSRLICAFDWLFASFANRNDLQLDFPCTAILNFCLKCGNDDTDDTDDDDDEKEEDACGDDAINEGNH